MRRAGECATDALLGAVAFWGPSILLQALRGDELLRSGIDVELITMAPLETTAASLLLLAWWRRRQTAVWRVALRQLFGLWALGPLCMMVGFGFSGGFTQPMSWRNIPALILLFPLFTPMMATYQGSLAGLGLTTFIMVGVVSKSLYSREGRQAH